MNLRCEILMQDFKAKLSDFGLARNGPAGNNTHVSTRVVGTYGYAAPEYIATGYISVILSAMHSFLSVFFSVSGIHSLEMKDRKNLTFIINNFNQNWFVHNTSKSHIYL